MGKNAADKTAPDRSSRSDCKPIGHAHGRHIGPTTALPRRPEQPPSPLLTFKARRNVTSICARLPCPQHACMPSPCIDLSVQKTVTHPHTSTSHTCTHAYGHTAKTPT